MRRVLFFVMVIVVLICVVILIVGLSISMRKVSGDVMSCWDCVLFGKHLKRNKVYEVLC